MNVKYINEGSAAIVRSIERTVQMLPKEAGILFVSVEGAPSFDGICKRFDISVGVKRDSSINESTLHALIDTVLLKDYPPDVCEIVKWITFGVQGMCVK